jgi:CheY-like chemotaxis protein
MIVSSATPLVILVVDDEPLVRVNAVDILEDAGFSTLEAEDAAQALKHIADHPEIGLLFTDINMPGEIDGLGLARLVHEDRPDLRVILTSGRRSQARLRCHSTGGSCQSPTRPPPCLNWSRPPERFSAALTLAVHPRRAARHAALRM